MGIGIGFKAWRALGLLWNSSTSSSHASRRRAKGGPNFRFTRWQFGLVGTIMYGSYMGNDAI